MLPKIQNQNNNIENSNIFTQLRNNSRIYENKGDENNNKNIGNNSMCLKKEQGQNLEKNNSLILDGNFNGKKIKNKL